MINDKSDQAKEQEGFEDNSTYKVADWVKKAIGVGMSGGVIPDFKLPKEVISLMLAQVERAKNEVVQVVAREVAHFLENLEIQDLIKKALAGSTLEINATIKVHNDASASIQAQKVSVKKNQTKKPVAKPTVKKTKL